MLQRNVDVNGKHLGQVEASIFRGNENRRVVVGLRGLGKNSGTLVRRPVQNFRFDLLHRPVLELGPQRGDQQLGVGFLSGREDRRNNNLGGCFVYHPMSRIHS